MAHDLLPPHTFNVLICLKFATESSGFGEKREACFLYGLLFRDQNTLGLCPDIFLYDLSHISISLYNVTTKGAFLSLYRNLLQPST